ncbi:MAG TPA: prepilin-type N-terminal cleavage/methylation domain-containing protein [Aquabacterium sp.]|nr:prepilin-type N-terminal cleavage/methylation domain-containing protein [Aquabacterium sp.]HRH29537.1 prepilin-type N-terminal cleavage/methylation domain-containing protein [Aquabacterium sp.]
MKSLPTRLSRRRAQSGFTLVEIAIVLVIIGLLLGGVLKGQELIENGRVKNAANDMNGISAAYTSYLDRYRRMPGDDGPTATIQQRGGSWTTIVGGDNNGRLTAVAAQTFLGGGETDNFFQHLRASGFITGNPGDVGQNALPINAWGGRLGVTSDAVQGRTAARLVTCLGNVPGKAAAALDVQLDDGRPDNGTLRATLGDTNTVPGAAAAAYNEAQTYTICRDLG